MNFSVFFSQKFCQYFCNRQSHKSYKVSSLTSSRETLAYAAANLVLASAVASVTFFGMVLPATAAILGPIGGASTRNSSSLLDGTDVTLDVPNLSELVASTVPATVQSPSQALQEVPEEVPVGFRKEFLRARAEQKKNGTNVFRYIQKGNIRGLTDSEQNGIGPGHGKSSSALEAAIASVSLRSWKQVRIDTLNRALGNQSFINFSRSINQRQREAGLPELSEFQLHNFMDISFWKAPEKGKPDMARETADSEYYQLPKLTPGVRASLIDTKLNYQEQIVDEAVATYGLTGRRLHDKLTGNQHLHEGEAKFVSDHLNAVRFARPENKTLALLRFGSEPYIRPPGTTPGTPPTTVAPPGTPPVTLAPPSAPPLLLVIPPDTPPVTLAPPLVPPLLAIPPKTPSVSRTPPVTPPLLVTPPETPSVSLTPLLGLLPLTLLPIVISSGTPPHTHTPSSKLPWNRAVVVMGPPVKVVPPVITERPGGGFPNTPTSPPTVETPTSPTTVNTPIFSTEQPIYVSESRTIPEPDSTLGIVAAGVGLLAVRVKARR